MLLLPFTTSHQNIRENRTPIETTDWMLAHFDIAAADKTSFIRARQLEINDFEDGVVVSLAEVKNCNFIITRNISDFKKSPVKAITPEEFLTFL